MGSLLAAVWLGLALLATPLAAQITVTIDDGDPRTPTITITLPAETVASLDQRRFDFGNPDASPPAPFSGTVAEHLEWIILREKDEAVTRYPTPAIAAIEAEEEAKRREKEQAKRDAVTVERKSR